MDTELGLENEYLGITEAAEYLRVSASTLRRWEKKGFLVPERTPTGIRRYTKKQLDDVIQAPQLEHNAVEYNTVVAEHPAVEQVSYANQSISNYTLEHQQVPNPITHEEPAVASPEEFTLNEITPAPDEEINELRDFFKKAGYDTSTTAEQTSINSQVEWPVSPAQDLASAEIQHMYPQAAQPVELEQPVVKKQEIVDEKITNVSQPEMTQTMPQIESFWKQAHAPAQERIEVFHEEHAESPARTAHNEELTTAQPLSYRTDDETGLETHEIYSENTHQHYSETEKEPRDSKKAYVRFLMIGLGIFVIAFVAWATYSYYSAPVELYSPVIQ